MRLPSLSEFPFEKIQSQSLEAFAFARSALYRTEAMVGPAVEFLMTGKRPRFAIDDPKLFRAAGASLVELLRRDVANISNGLYPIEVLRPESPLKHLRRLPMMLFEIAGFAKRRGQKKAHQFSKEARELLEGLPEYYQRNFHFQDDGYLSEKSAELYEHQVELLFSGAADAMRRLVIPQLKRHFGEDHDGTGLTFLELAAGTGRGTRFVRLAFPKAKIVAVDLSAPYLKRAQEQLKSFARHDFVEANASDLPFKDEAFDAVFSIFLFHELPLAERKAVIRESLRVLKTGGFHGALDSIQLGDQPDFDPALELFPKEFHEPFYKNYIQTPLETVLTDQGLSDLDVNKGFFSKSISAVKRDSVVETSNSLAN